MSTARKILSNTVIQVVGKVGASVVGVVTVKLLTNYLGKAGYGEYTQVYEWLSLFGIIADLGLFTIAVREMSRDEKKIPYIMGNVLTVRILAAALVMLLAVGMAFVLPRYQGTYVPLGVAIASLGVFLSIVTSTISSVLQVYLQMTKATIALLVGRFVSLGYLVTAVFIFKNDPAAGFPHLMWSGVFGAIVMTGLTAWYARQFTNLRPRLDWSFWKEVVVVSLPYGLALVLNMVYFRISSVLLFNIKGSTESGLFAVPSKITEIMGVVAIYFMNSVLPTLTKHIGQADQPESKQKAKQIIQYCFDFLSACGWPIVVGGVVLAYPLTFAISSPEFLSRLSEGFYGSDVALQIMVVALFLSYLTTLFGFVLIALGKQNQLLWTSSLGVILSVGLNLWLIPLYGFRGAAVTNVVSELAILAVLFQVTRRFIDYKLTWSGFLKALISAVTMGLILTWLRDPAYRLMGGFSLILLLGLGVVIYLIMMIVTRGLTKDMMRLLKKTS